MRLHKPVAPHQQPHLEQFFGGGIPTNGYDDGGVVDPNSFLGWPKETPGFEEGGQVDPNEFLNPVPDTGSDNLQALADHANQVYTDYHKRLEDEWHGSRGSRDSENDDQGYARGGKVKKDDGLDQEERMLAQDEAKFEHIDDAEERALAEDDRKYQQGYATGGTVDPDEGDPRYENILHESVDNVPPYNSFTQSDAKLNKDDDLPEIPVINGQPATATGRKLKADSFPPDSSYHTYSHGGGIPPGPAGPGVKPQSPKGNPGRPNYTDPNTKAPAEKNYAQNVTARQFTSPSVGTAFEQPAPVGGQRGQEWYGKGRK